MPEENDVNLYDKLAEELKKGEEEQESSGASDEKPDDKDIDQKKDDDKKPEGGELSEEEISKLSPRAQSRIRDLAAKVKELSEKPADKTPDDKEEKPDDKAPENYKNVQEFLAAVQDEPSRKLLEAFHKVITGEISETLSPVQIANNKTKFETEFAKYEKVDGLKDYHDDLLKTYMKDPSVSPTSLIKDTIADLTIDKVKPTDDTPTDPDRKGEIDTSNMDTEQLYDLLDKNRPAQ